MELTDEIGKPIFENIQITLVCEECQKTEHPELCKHKLGSLPRWISSAKVEVVRTLLADDPAMVLRETLGVSGARPPTPQKRALTPRGCPAQLAADGSTKAYRFDDVDGFLRRPPDALLCNTRDSAQNIFQFFVAVDPCGVRLLVAQPLPGRSARPHAPLAHTCVQGGASAFSVTSVLVTPSGAFQARPSSNGPTAPKSDACHMLAATPTATTNASGLWKNWE